MEIEYRRPSNIFSFYADNRVVASLNVKDGTVTFDGDADAAAKVLFDAFRSLLNDHWEHEHRISSLVERVRIRAAIQSCAPSEVPYSSAKHEWMRLGKKELFAQILKAIDHLAADGTSAAPEKGPL